MKKILYLILSAILVLSMGICAFAQTNDGTSSTNITVNGTYVSADDAAEIISVDIVWGAMSFTYTEGSNGNWNSNKHQYDNVTEGAWTASGNDITITNHSNTNIKAALEFTASIDGIIGSFTESSGTANDSILELATAENTEYASAPTATAYFNITSGAISSNGTLGNISVSIIKTVAATPPSNSNGNTSDTSQDESSESGDVSTTESLITGITLNTESAYYDAANKKFNLVDNGDDLIITVSGQNLTALDSSNTTFGLIVGSVFFPIYETSKTGYSCVIESDTTAVLTFSHEFEFIGSDIICYKNGINGIVNTEYTLILDNENIY